MADFGPPSQITQDDLLDALKRNFEDHWIGGLLEDATASSIFLGWIDAALRVQDAVDENLYVGTFILTAPGQTKANSVVRLQRPSGAATTIYTSNRFIDDRGAVWNPSAEVAVAFSGSTQTIDVPIQTERAGYWLNSFLPLTYQILDDLLDPNWVVLPGPDPAEDGKTAFLDQHGKERKVLRANGESDEKYAARMVFLQDQVSPKAISETVLQVLDGFPVSKDTATLIAIHGLRATREPFRDSSQIAQVGLVGSDQPFADDAYADDVDGHLIRDREEFCAWFDVLLPTFVDPDEMRLFLDDGYLDDPELGFMDLGPSDALLAPVAALADELDRRRAACVKFQIIQGGEVSLLRHPNLGSLSQAGDWIAIDDGVSGVTDSDFVDALVEFDGDYRYAQSVSGRGSGSSLSAGDLLFALPDIPDPVSVSHVILRARVRQSSVGSTDPGFTFLIKPTTAGAAQRVLVPSSPGYPFAFPATVDHSTWREYVAILEQNPVTTSAWTVADIAGVVEIGVANTAAIGATDQLRVSELSVELVVSYG